MEVLMLEKTSKLIKSTLWPNTTLLTNCTVTCHITHLLSSCRDGDSTTPLGSLFQSLTTLSVKKFFLTSNLNLPWHSLKPFPLTLLLFKRLTCSSISLSFLWHSHSAWCPLQLDWPQSWALGDTSSDWATGFHSIPMEVTGFMQRWHN